MADSKRAGFVAGICLALALVTLGVYWPVTHHDFVNLDDHAYIVDNPHIQSGLTWPAVIWAFRSGYAATWHPLAWMSHMLDCQWYGLSPGGHHLTSLLFHVANTVLLFLLLNRMTGSRWRSATVAALFAWHPLHVQSVAWACERKDVLSAFFWMLTMMAYVRYAEGVTSDKWRVTGEESIASSPAVPPVTRHASLFYGLALLLFALGLMSKSMVVTLPCVLLLVDFWPLRRFQPSTLNSQLSTLRRLVLEKLPFFALTLTASVATYLTQKGGGAMWSPPWHLRIANALVTYFTYVSKTFWPINLAVVYPYPRHWPVGLVIAAASLLAIWSALFMLRARRRPYFIMGWLWYLGTLVPTIGLVQVGSQSMADRFTYIPGIGLFVLLVWGVNDLLASWPHKRLLLASGATVVLSGCLVCTRIQLGYWHDSIKLFRHALEVTTDNYVACECLGKTLDDLGLKDEALSLYAEAVRVEPHYPPAQYKLGMALSEKGRVKEAIDHLTTAMQLAPHNPEGQYNLGMTLMKEGRIEEAMSHFATALADNPSLAAAHTSLGNALLKQGKLEEAAAHFSQAVTLKPDDPDAHYNLGTVLLTQSKAGEAAAQLSEAVRLNPDNEEAHKNLAVALMMQGKTGDAVAHFSEAVRLRSADPEARFNFGLALLDQNKPGEAAVQFTEVLRLRPDDAKSHYRLAIALARQHDSKGAVFHYREVLRLSPDFPDALNELAWILSTDPNLEVRAGSEAVRLAERSCELTQHKQPVMLTTLAAAYAETGRFSEAATTAEKARAMALAAGQKELAARAAELFEMCKSARPFREAF